MFQYAPEHLRQVRDIQPGVPADQNVDRLGTECRGQRLDVCALSDNKVSITPIYLDLTNIPVLSALRRVFEG